MTLETCSYDKAGIPPMKELEWQVASRCAPVLCGIKVSNLITLPGGASRVVKSLLGDNGVLVAALAEKRRREALLLYRPRELSAWLMEKEVQNLLNSFGYGPYDLASVLLRLRYRYQEYASGEPASHEPASSGELTSGVPASREPASGEPASRVPASGEPAPFPHEVGVILGYPPGDVRGFIENGGCRFLFSGYWKVYQDADRAKAVFCSYDLAREELLEKLREDCPLWRAVKTIMSEGEKKNE